MQAFLKTQNTFSAVADNVWHDRRKRLKKPVFD